MNLDPKLIEAVILACLEKTPVDFRKVGDAEVKRAGAAIKRATAPKGAAHQYQLSRKHFLLRLPRLHGSPGGRTPDRRLWLSLPQYDRHRAGQPCRRRAAAGCHSDYIRAEIRRRHFHRSDPEVIVFHNHPRTGREPEWFYRLKSPLQDLPIASNDDRRPLQDHAFNPVGLFRQFFGQGQVLFYLGESGFVKEFRLPPILPFLEQLNRMNVQQAVK